MSVPGSEGAMCASVRIDGGLQRYCCGVRDLVAFISPLPWLLSGTAGSSWGQDSGMRATELLGGEPCPQGLVL